MDADGTLTLRSAVVKRDQRRGFNLGTAGIPAPLDKDAV
jgi:hypothetical protein